MYSPSCSKPMTFFLLSNTKYDVLENVQTAIGIQCKWMGGDTVTATGTKKHHKSPIKVVYMTSEAWVLRCVNAYLYFTIRYIQQILKIKVPIGGFHSDGMF